MALDNFTVGTTTFLKFTTMKTLRWMGAALLLMTLSLGFAACSDDDEPEPAPDAVPYITMSPLEFKIDNSEQDVVQIVKTNKENWEVMMMSDGSDSCSWCSLKSKSLNTTRALEDDIPEYTYVFHVKANDTGKPRTVIFNYKRLGYMMYTASSITQNK